MSVQTIYVVITEYGMDIYNNRDAAEKHVDDYGGIQLQMPTSTSTAGPKYITEIRTMRVKSKYRRY